MSFHGETFSSVFLRRIIHIHTFCVCIRNWLLVCFVLWRISFPGALHVMLQLITQIRWLQAVRKMAYMYHSTAGLIQLLEAKIHLNQNLLFFMCSIPSLMRTGCFVLHSVESPVISMPAFLVPDVGLRKK